MSLRFAVMQSNTRPRSSAAWPSILNWTFRLSTVLFVVPNLLVTQNSAQWSSGTSPSWKVISGARLRIAVPGQKRFGDSTTRNCGNSSAGASLMPRFAFSAILTRRFGSPLPPPNPADLPFYLVVTSIRWSRGMAAYGSAGSREYFGRFCTAWQTRFWFHPAVPAH